MKKYIAVYEKLKQDITEQKYKYGAKLPSKRNIAENLGVSLITAEQALDLLISEGYINSKERAGYFICYRNDLYGNNSADSSYVKSLVTSRALHAENQKEYFPFTPFATAIRKILSDKGDKITEKSPNAGTKELRDAIADYLFRNRGIRVDSERIIVGAGSEYLYGMFAETLKGRIFAIENPCYDKIEKVYRSRGVVYEKLSISENGIPSECLIKSRASVLHITPFQSYPTGISIDISKKKEYLDFAEQRDGFIIEDDYASEFSITAKLADTVFAVDKYDRVIYVNSFSKSIFPSIRVAYAVIPERLFSDYNKKAGFYSCPVPVLEQSVIAEILNNGSFERHINKIRRLKRTAKKE